MLEISISWKFTLPVGNCTQERLGERMDENNDDESVFVEFLDLRIDVLLERKL